MPVEVKGNLSRAAVNGQLFMDTVIRTEAFRIERDMKRSMKGTKSGRGYYRGGKGRKKYHWASAPGEPPARDTGYLADSIHVLDAMPHVVYVMIDAEYAGHLEHGTYKMKPRPFVAPAVEKARLRIARMRVPVKVLIAGPPSV